MHYISTPDEPDFPAIHLHSLACIVLAMPRKEGEELDDIARAVAESLIDLSQRWYRELAGAIPCPDEAIWSSLEDTTVGQLRVLTHDDGSRDGDERMSDYEMGFRDGHDSKGGANA